MLWGCSRTGMTAMRKTERWGRMAHWAMHQLNMPASSPRHALTKLALTSSCQRLLSPSRRSSASRQPFASPPKRRRCKTPSSGAGTAWYALVCVFTVPNGHHATLGRDMRDVAAQLHTGFLCAALLWVADMLHCQDCSVAVIPGAAGRHDY
jgi:hypothetical protein